MTLNSKQKSQLWWLIISCDYDYDRIIIADHDLDDGNLTLWLEDKHDFKNSLDECLEIIVPVKEFAKFIKTENLNSNEEEVIDGRSGKLRLAYVEIDTPVTWYNSIASLSEQQQAREVLLKKLLTILVENDLPATDEFDTAA